MEIVIALLVIGLVASIILMVISYSKYEQTKVDLELMRCLNEMERSATGTYRELYKQALAEKQEQEQNILKGIRQRIVERTLKENDVQLALIPTGISPVDYASGFTPEESEEEYRRVIEARDKAKN